MDTCQKQPTSGAANSEVKCLSAMPTATAKNTAKQADLFMSACWDGDTQKVLTMLKAGFDVDHQHPKPLTFAARLQDSKLTGLMYASIQGHTEVVEMLLARGADIRVQSKLRNTALSFAAPLGRTAIVEALLSRGADPDDTFTAGFGVFSVLHQACHNGHMETVKALIAKGADVSLDKYGSPLQAAAEVGHVGIIQELLRAGALPNSPKRKPIITAAAAGRDKVVRLLLSAGADIDCTDTWGMTPLMWAARNGRVATVKLLLTKKARLDILSDSLGQGTLTALGFAEREGHLDVVRLLKQAGAGQKQETPKPFKVRVRRGGEWITE